MSMVADFLKSMSMRKGSDLHLIAGIRRVCACTAI